MLQYFPETLDSIVLLQKLWYIVSIWSRMLDTSQIGGKLPSFGGTVTLESKLYGRIK
jgi:hypothetical protein